jgi:hypothetical protein
MKPSGNVRESTLYLPKEQQADAYFINRAIILATVQRATNDQVPGLLEERADSIRTFAASGDVDFFRALGRLLSAPGDSNLRRHEYAFRILSNWLTNFLWLMPEKIASDLIAGWHGTKPKTAKQSDKVLRHFKAVKGAYQLKAHSPSLVSCIKPGGILAFTPKGSEILASVL